MAKVLIGVLLGLLILRLIGALVVFSGHFPFEATNQQPQWERKLANMALDPAVENKAKGLTDPMAPSDDNLVKGMKLYRENRASCHGEADKVSGWGRNDLYPRAPQLGQRGDEDPVAEIFVVVKHGVRNTPWAAGRTCCRTMISGASPRS